MNVLRLSALLGTVLAAAATDAAQAWQSKPFNTWTDEELKEVVTDSPWAGRADLTRVQTPGSGFAPISQFALVSWSSALPLRQAEERGRLKTGAGVSRETEARLAATPASYVITVTIRGTLRPSDLLSQSARIRSVTALRRLGKPSVSPTTIEERAFDRNGRPIEAPTPDGPRRAAMFLFMFPKTDPLTLGDKEVEFTTRLCSALAPKPDMDIVSMSEFGGGPLSPQCNLNVKKKFRLSDMVYNGALAL